ncbi:MAG: 2'-5' RNA ligase family protein [bacterium]
MLKRCILVFTEFNNMEILDAIRDKYDPLDDHVRPHITLVFSFESNLVRSEIERHMVEVLSGVNPFALQLRGIRSNKSNYGNFIFLDVKKGNEEIIDIHNNLYTGLLEKYKPRWLIENSYKPHMTVGRIDSEEKFQLALDEVADIQDIFQTEVDKITVEIIDQNEDSIIELEVRL